MLFPQLAKQVSRAANRTPVRSASARNLQPTLRANLPKNVVTKGMNEPNIRVSDRMLDGRKRQLSRGTVPITKSNPSPSAKVHTSGTYEENGRTYGYAGVEGSKGDLAGAIFNPKITTDGKKRTVNRGSLSGGSSMNGGRVKEPQASAGGGGGNGPTPPGPNNPPDGPYGPAFPERAHGPAFPERAHGPGFPERAHGPAFPERAHGPAFPDKKWRGIEDIKNTVSGQVPLSTFFRNKNARDHMMASGKGADYEWGKGTISKARVAGTAAAGYAAIDTIDRAGSGGSITRNETGRFDMMGIPIL